MILRISYVGSCFDEPLVSTGARDKCCRYVRTIYSEHQWPFRWGCRRLCNQQDKQPIRTLNRKLNAKLLTKPSMQVFVQRIKEEEQYFLGLLKAESKSRPEKPKPKPVITPTILPADYISFVASYLWRKLLNENFDYHSLFCVWIFIIMKGVVMFSSATTIDVCEE